jgi:membrane protein YqaA with SNARE-associated domain
MATTKSAQQRFGHVVTTLSAWQTPEQKSFVLVITVTRHFRVILVALDAGT